MRLSPFDPLGHVFAHGLSLAHFIAGRYEQSLEWAEQLSREQPRYIPPLQIKVPLYVHFGRIDEAKALLQRVLELTPGLTIAKLEAYGRKFFSQDMVNTVLEGFRKVGLPEE